MQQPISAKWRAILLKCSLAKLWIKKNYYLWFQILSILCRGLGKKQRYGNNSIIPILLNWKITKRHLIISIFSLSIVPKAVLSHICPKTDFRLMFPRGLLSLNNWYQHVRIWKKIIRFIVILNLLIFSFIRTSWNWGTLDWSGSLIFKIRSQ